MEQIKGFKGEYQYLSNFAEYPIRYEGIVYGSSEAAFQAQKCCTEYEKLRFTGIRAGQSKRVGRRVNLRPDWEDVKVAIMKDIVTQKFIQWPQLAKKLINTGNAELIEYNNWGDKFWGVTAHGGENHLGIILMEIRDDLRSGKLQINA